MLKTNKILNSRNIYMNNNYKNYENIFHDKRKFIFIIKSLFLYHFNL